MYEGGARSARETRQSQSRIASRVGTRPDRIALWAVFMAIFGIFIAIATANADSGGVSGGGGTGAGEDCANCEWGDRELHKDDTGRDAQILNYIMRSKHWSSGVPMDKTFNGGTEGAVMEFEQRHSLAVNGWVGERGTVDFTEIRDSITKYKATWYGPGLYGNPLACGGKLHRSTTGVAHRTLPCGTKVLFRSGGKSVKTKVIDRGPFVSGITWDLTEATAEKLGWKNHGSKIRAAVPRNQ